ncbi:MULTISPECIES: hypothetical protein [unclassified Arthrobacter]|uniref:hypothetical protein n=1 Tax=unclassified Arthrobacter TaxID=235627 RepID=UPI001C84A96C|nr:hypothetical protein [Arthrobacter sp. MAHUQ-56]MBX7445452.1 hypothetical protein [Arthrobacter sp. MAHUQ-56]
MTDKSKRPAGGRANEISGGDYNQYKAASCLYCCTGPFISTATWSLWELRRYRLETETPGRFGTYSKEDAK